MVGIFTEFSLSPSSPRSQSLPHTDSWVKTQHGFSKTFTQRRPPPQMTPCIPTLQGLTLLSLTRFTVHYLFCFCFCIFFCLSPAASPCVYTHTHTHTHTLSHSHSYAVNLSKNEMLSLRLKFLLDSMRCFQFPALLWLPPYSVLLWDARPAGDLLVFLWP